MSQNVHADTACRYPANNADRMGRSKQRISFLGEGAPWGGAGAVKEADEDGDDDWEDNVADDWENMA